MCILDQLSAGVSPPSDALNDTDVESYCEELELDFSSEEFDFEM